MTDAKRLIWVSEHDAPRADMNDLAAAMGVLESQLAAGKALTAWQVRACGESYRCSAELCYHAGYERVLVWPSGLAVLRERLVGRAVRARVPKR